MARREMIARGHIVLIQGLSFECPRCGRTAGLNDQTWGIIGELADAKACNG